VGDVSRHPSSGGTGIVTRAPLALERAWVLRVGHDGAHGGTPARDTWGDGRILPRPAAIAGAERTSVAVESGRSVSTHAEPYDEAQFRALFYRHVRAIASYVGRHYPGSNADADDIVNETFAVAWRRWADIPAGGERPWLIGVARHLIRNSMRSRRRRDAFVGALLAFRPQVTTDLAGDRLLAEDVEPMRRAFATLPERDQEVLLLAAWEDLRGAELGAVLGVSADQASMWLHRARRRLRARTTEQLEST
jgi:RNA polymerase sigma-70 factor (ECF subfamily)